jgi:hypothetical protein
MMEDEISLEFGIAVSHALAREGIVLPPERWAALLGMIYAFIGEGEVV